MLQHFLKIGKVLARKLFFLDEFLIHEARQLVWTTGGLASQGATQPRSRSQVCQQSVNSSMTNRFKIQNLVLFGHASSRQRFHPWFVCSLCIEYMQKCGCIYSERCGDVCFFSGAIDPCCCQRFGVRVNLFGLVKAECMDIPNHCVRSGPSRAVLESQGISTWCFIALHCACCDHQNYMHHVKHGVTSRSDLKNAWHAMTCHDSHDINPHRQTTPFVATSSPLRSRPGRVSRISLVDFA